MKSKFRVKNYVRLLEFMERNGIENERINFVFGCFAFGRKNRKSGKLLNAVLNRK